MKKEKEFLLMQIESASHYRSCKYEQYPDDKRNLFSSQSLNVLYDFVNELPEDHPVFYNFYKLYYECENYFTFSEYGFYSDIIPESFLEEIFLSYSAGILTTKDINQN